MKKKLIYFIVFTLLAYSQPAISQKSVVSVNSMTGSPIINLPLYNLKTGPMSMPVSLSYATSGVRPTDIENLAGIDWYLIAGGQIARTLHGLPDDVTKDQGGNNRYGWMSTSNTAASAIGGFNIQNNGANCTYETNDNTSITNNFPISYDTEPDIFNVSAPGLNCQLIYDRVSGKFKPVVYQDLVIAYTTNPTSGLITSFTITNDSGTKYTFSATEYVQLGTSGSSPSFFTTKFQQYQNKIVYYDAWYLTSLTDSYGNGFVLDYTADFPRPSTNLVDLYMPNATTNTHQYSVQMSVTRELLKDIQTVNAAGTKNMLLNFTFVINGQPGAVPSVLSSIAGMGRTTNFTYSATVPTGGGYHKQFLRTIVDFGCSTPINYSFSYAGETLTSGVYYSILPDTGTKMVDYWGYYCSNSNTTLQPKISINPSTAGFPKYTLYEPATSQTQYPYITVGNDRRTSATNLNAGCLTQITYANGGTSTIVYEPNDYLDGSDNTVVQGGGVRVKQIIDNNKATATVTRNFSYINPSTTLSSGKPISLPEFAFTVPYSGSGTGSTEWNSSTVLSDYDLSDADHSILYEYFTQSQTGAGSITQQFYLPATYWDNTAAPDCSGCSVEWAPSTNYFGRMNCTGAYGPMGNGKDLYPFVPDPNYDFERSVRKAIISYNDAGTKVSEDDYTYQRSYIPSVITAFRFDGGTASGLSFRSYGKYPVYYMTSELVSNVTHKVYDSPTLSVAQTTSSSYVYGGTNHKKVTQQMLTNSDNRIVTTNIRYVKDYTLSSGSDPNITALYNLGQFNINAPVETWQQLTNNGTTVTTAAGLTLYSLFPVTYMHGLATVNYYLPSQHKSLIEPNGVPSTTDANPFAQFAISGQTSTKDSRYNVDKNFDFYDYTGTLQTADDNNHNLVTSIYDANVNQPVATFTNTAINEIGFDNFDTDPTFANDANYHFAYSGTTVNSSTGSHSGNALSIGPSNTITKTVHKNLYALNYIFSAWIYSTAAGNLAITLNGNTISKPYTAGGWTYYEWKLPINSITASTLTLSVTPGSPISIDDILFYPDISKVNTFSYDPVTFALISQTNGNGVSTYFKSDQWNRLLYKFDQDKNIIEKRSYWNSIQTPTAYTVSNSIQNVTVSPNNPAYASQATTFTVDTNACAPSFIYSWNFGDGTTIGPTAGASLVRHAYSAAGSYNVSVIVSHPTLGTATYNIPVNVQLPPLIIQTCESGVQEWNSGCNSADPSEPPLYGMCGSPGSTTATYYNVHFVNGGIGTLTYSWKMRQYGGSTWTNISSYPTSNIGPVTISPDGLTCSIQYGSYTTASYEIECVVTSSSGQTGSANFPAFYTNPTCMH